VEKYEEQLKEKGLVSVRLIEFEADLKEEYKNFKVNVIPLFGGYLNTKKRYALILCAQIGENVDIQYEESEGVWIVKKKEVENHENKNEI
jgi:hypothetical protein